MQSRLLVNDVGRSESLDNLALQLQPLPLPPQGYRYGTWLELSLFYGFDFKGKQNQLDD